MLRNERLWLALLIGGWALPALAEKNQHILNEPEAFKPSWSFSVGLSTSGQPSDGGGGSQSTDLSFNATHELTDSGHYLSFGALSGRTKIGSDISTYGSLTVTGGLGLGAFCPSLYVQGQKGEASLGNLSGGLDLGFQIADDLSAALSGYGGFYSVEARAFGARLAVDTRTWGAGASVSFVPWDFMVVTLSGQQNQDTTFRVRNLNTSAEITVEKVVRTPSASLGFDFSFWDDISLGCSVQRGQVFSPPGLLWRPDLGAFVQLGAEEISYFWGYSFGVSYNFQ